MRKSKKEEDGSKIWFLEVVVIMLLVIDGLEKNLGKPSEQVRIHHTLAHVKNEEKK
jgi:hypothetical protein